MGENTTQNQNEDYGFGIYPERRNVKDHSFMKHFTLEVENIPHHKRTCERNVLKALKENHLVKVLYQALKNAGCPVNLRRHIVCEPCDSRVTGGYDCEYNQIVICENILKSRKLPEAVLVHELVHMYDYCVGEIDFKNMDHLACTEIRAANIAHCSFISSLFLGQSSPINIKRTHQYCVKIKAAQSIMVARNVDFPTAMKHILKVFDKCYNDLEPIGRRIRRSSVDPLLSFRDAEFRNQWKEQEEKK